MSPFGKPCKGCNTRGKKNLRYREQNDALRFIFLEEIKDIPVENLVFIDETGMDEDLQRLHGWSPRGEQILGTHTGRRVRRVSLIAALCKKHIQAPMRFEGHCDSSVVNAWILLPPYSPDFNPIEHSWAALKSKIKSLRHHYKTIEACIDQSLYALNYS